MLTQPYEAFSQTASLKHHSFVTYSLMLCKRTVSCNQVENNTVGPCRQGLKYQAFTGGTLNKTWTLRVVTSNMLIVSENFVGRTQNFFQGK